MRAPPTNSLSRLWTYVWQLWQLPGTKKLVSLMALLIAMYLGWRRLQAGRRRPQQQQQGVGAGAGAGAGAVGGAGAAAGGGAGGGGGGAAAANTERAAAAALRRAATISTDTVVGRVTKYLGATAAGHAPVPAAVPRLTVVLSARIILSGLHAQNSDGLSEPVDVAAHHRSSSSSSSSSSASRAQVLQLLTALCARCTVYVLTKVPTNPSALEERVINALDAAGLLAPGYIKPHNVLFCSSGAGKSAMIRHITPNLVLDDEYDILEKLRPYVDDVVHVPACDAPAAAAAASSSAAMPSFTATGGSKNSGVVGRAASLAHYFGLPQFSPAAATSSGGTANSVDAGAAASAAMKTA